MLNKFLYYSYFTLSLKLNFRTRYGNTNNSDGLNSDRFLYETRAD